MEVEGVVAEGKRFESLRANKTHRFVVHRPWIEIQLVDEAGGPCEDEAFELELPDGSVERGKLDGNGMFRKTLTAPGTCKVRFPELDRDAWESIDSGAEAETAGPSGA